MPDVFSWAMFVRPEGGATLERVSTLIAGKKTVLKLINVISHAAQFTLFELLI